jgi:hypothetical protein
MRKLVTNVFLLLMCVIATAKSAINTKQNLQEAIKNNIVKCRILGNSESTHYLEPIIASLNNVTNETITLQINNGDLFIPTDSNKQNIVVTKEEIFVLKPLEKKVLKIKGMCTEQKDGAGNNETVYIYQPNNQKQLKQLSAFIHLKKYQTSAAQYAVWSLMNNSDLNSIYSSDSTEENELKKFMASLTGKTFEILNKNYRYNYYEPPKEKVGGKFEYNFAKQQDVQIAMFDKNGILVRELFNQKNVPAGEHAFNFEFDSSVYTDDIYYFKLIAMNDVLVNQKWNIKDIRDRLKQKIQNR